MKYLIALAVALTSLSSIAEVPKNAEPIMACYFNGNLIGTMTPTQCFSKGGALYHVQRSSSRSSS
ncbi:hypothetical protein KI655_04350 [Vibrio sp. D404a]|uniref:hypothetical protein n=1 Tax=unclassified Vibrio TaxID=2614977 RepID=UPI002556E85E|nr:MULTISPECIES: hypothetical protein [unclassified Vibrio]MDK9736523.1 hypothetical protein [Vibrio sp. D404a]MDK9796832.1 hypothetical protein [Vibrio sp. D449a]